MSLVVLAAGIGSRYGGLKQMDPMGPSGEFIIDYSVFDALRAGFDHVVFVVSRQIEKDFRAVIGARFENRLAVEYVFQDPDDLPAGFTMPADRKKPWGTGHAVRACRNVIKTPFAVINADDFYGRQSYELLAGFLKKVSPGRTDFCLAAFILRNTLSEHGHVARGVCEIDPSGFLKSVTERTRIEKTVTGARFLVADDKWQDLTGDELVSMNTWGFTPALFGFLEEEFPKFLAAEGKNPKAEFFIPTVVDTLIRAKKAKVTVERTPESWFGVTYPNDKPVVIERLRALIAAGVYPANLWKRP